MGIGAGLETYLLMMAGLFTLACAIPSSALWPYGLGTMLILAARRLKSAQMDTLLPKELMILGMLLCAVFLVAPIMF